VLEFCVRTGSLTAIAYHFYIVYIWYCMEFRVGLINDNMDHVEIVYRVGIYQGLLVKFSCDLYKTFIFNGF